MKTESWIVETLLADPDVTTSLNGGGIYPVKVPVGGNLPAITYKRKATQLYSTITDSTGCSLVTVEISCWSDSYDEAKRLSVSSHNAVARGVSVLLTDGNDDWDEDSQMYKVTAEYSILEEGE